MEKLKRRVAIDMVLNEKVKELTAEAMSCLIKMMGMKSEIEAIEERIKTNTPFTDDDRKLIEPFYRAVKSLHKAILIGSACSLYRGVNEGAIHSSIFVEDEELEKEIDHEHDEKFRNFVNILFRR